jgi:hypothetical protein
VVEVIGNEVISAANSTNALENNATVLIHCWVNPGGPLKFTIKSTSQRVIEEL